MSPKTKEQGFSLVEAMIATLITAISFTGVFSMTAVSSIAMKNSIDRQKMQVIANEMLEMINVDSANATYYNDMDFTACTAPGAGQTQQYHINRYRWCRMLNEAVGQAATGDVRTIRVTSSGNNKVVHIILQNRNNKTQIVTNSIL